MDQAELQRRILDVVSQMKEIPVLPSEAPKDVNPLQRVEFPDRGGVLTYMGGQPFPYKGFPFFEFVDKIDILKKISRAILSGFYHQLKRKKLLWITLLPALWIIKPAARVFLYVSFRLVDRFKLRPDKYCDAAREVYRAFTPVDNNEFQLMFRDFLCMTLEMDNAYRYRFQDIIVLLDKYALKKRPIKEIFRLLRILSQRELTEDIKDTWVLLKIALTLYLRTDRECVRMLVRCLLQLDLEQVQLTIEDKIYAAGRKDYVFGFMLKPDADPDAPYCIAFNKVREAWVGQKSAIQDESTDKHQELFTIQGEAQQKLAPKVDDKKKEHIQKEISEKAQAIYKERDEKIGKIAQEYTEREKQIVGAYLTPAQRTLADTQTQEIIAMNGVYEKKLKDAEDTFRSKCEELQKLLPKKYERH